MRRGQTTRVLFISDHFFPETFLGNEIPPFLSENGCNVEVLTQNPAYPEGKLYSGESNPLFRITRMGKVRVFRLKTVLGYRDSLIRKIANYLWFMTAASIFFIVRWYRYDSVFVYHVGALTEALPLYIAKRVFGRRTAIWTLDIWPDSVFSFGFKRTPILARMLDGFVSGIYNSCDSIMVGSPGFIEKLGRFVPKANKPAFIPQWAPKELFQEEQPPFTFRCDGLNFVFAGNVGTQQNLERVIGAFDSVEKSGKLAHLHIVGDGRSLDAAKAAATRLRSSCIHFYPRIPQVQILRLLRTADACVLSLNPDPSIELTLPAKFQTYLHSGLPILCVACGESRSLVERHMIGEVAEPDSIESIADAINRICEYTGDRRAEIAARMTALSNESFKEETSMRRILCEITGATA